MNPSAPAVAIQPLGRARAAEEREEVRQERILAPARGDRLAAPGPPRDVPRPLVVGFASGPAQLAWISEAPVLPIFFPLMDGAVSIEIEAPIRARPDEGREAAVARITAELASVYALTIERHPEQWFTFFDFFGEGPR